MLEPHVEEIGHILQLVEVQAQQDFLLMDKKGILGVIVIIMEHKLLL